MSRWPLCFEGVHGIDIDFVNLIHRRIPNGILLLWSCDEAALCVMLALLTPWWKDGVSIAIQHYLKNLDQRRVY